MKKIACTSLIVFFIFNAVLSGAERPLHSIPEGANLLLLKDIKVPAPSDLYFIQGDIGTSSGYNVDLTRPYCTIIFSSTAETNYLRKGDLLLIKQIRQFYYKNTGNIFITTLEVDASGVARIDCSLSGENSHYITEEEFSDVMRVFMLLGY